MEKLDSLYYNVAVQTPDRSKTEESRQQIDNDNPLYDEVSFEGSCNYDISEPSDDGPLYDKVATDMPCSCHLGRSIQEEALGHGRCNPHVQNTEMSGLNTCTGGTCLYGGTVPIYDNAVSETATTLPDISGIPGSHLDHAEESCENDSCVSNEQSSGERTLYQDCDDNYHVIHSEFAGSGESISEPGRSTSQSSSSASAQQLAHTPNTRHTYMYEAPTYATVTKPTPRANMALQNTVFVENYLYEHEPSSDEEEAPPVPEKQFISEEPAGTFHSIQCECKTKASPGTAEQPDSTCLCVLEYYDIPGLVADEQTTVRNPAQRDSSFLRVADLQRKSKSRRSVSLKDEAPYCDIHDVVSSFRMRRSLSHPTDSDACLNEIDLNCPRDLSANTSNPENTYYNVIDPSTDLRESRGMGFACVAGMGTLAEYNELVTRNIHSHDIDYESPYHDIADFSRLTNEDARSNRTESPYHNILDLQVSVNSESAFPTRSVEFNSDSQEPSSPTNIYDDIKEIFCSNSQEDGPREEDAQRETQSKQRETKNKVVETLEGNDTVHASRSRKVGSLQTELVLSCVNLIMNTTQISDTLANRQHEDAQESQNQTEGDKSCDNGDKRNDNLPAYNTVFLGEEGTSKETIDMHMMHLCKSGDKQNSRRNSSDTVKTKRNSTSEFPSKPSHLKKIKHAATGLLRIVRKLSNSSNSEKYDMKMCNKWASHSDLRITQVNRGPATRLRRSQSIIIAADDNPPQEISPADVPSLHTAGLPPHDGMQATQQNLVAQTPRSRSQADEVFLEDSMLCGYENSKISFGTLSQSSLSEELLPHHPTSHRDVDAAKPKSKLGRMKLNVSMMSRPAPVRTTSDTNKPEEREVDSSRQSPKSSIKHIKRSGGSVVRERLREDKHRSMSSPSAMLSPGKRIFRKMGTERKTMDVGGIPIIDRIRRK